MMYSIWNKCADCSAHGLRTCVLLVRTHKNSFSSSVSEDPLQNHFGYCKQHSNSGQQKAQVNWVHCTVLVLVSKPNDLILD